MALHLNNATYLLSAHLQSQLPPDQGVEVAFAGRSNAGKSSAINAICGHRRLAHTSRTPGRTQQIVFFELDPDHRLVDLPGYGFAKVPLKLKQHWERFVGGFLQRRQALKGLILVMDIRHPMRPGDETILQWCAGSRLPCHVLLSKADKPSRGQAEATRLQVAKTLSTMGGAFTVQTFSALKKTGVEPARDVLHGWLNRDEAPAEGGADAEA